MAISRARKEELVTQYVDLLERSDAVIMTDYTGMGVKQLEELRVEVRKAEGALYVTKNTLLRVALEQVGKPVPTDLLNGQVAVGFALGEAPTLAKALADYADKEDIFEIKGGLFGDEVISKDQVESLAKMPSLDQLRGQMVGLLSAPARNLASVVASGVRQVVNVLDAYAKKDDAEAPA
ncbi:MAG: 50S ribosomal protein L10 [Ardenticatenaceae bacterium]|nr:50S ribosomal protein L10 [Ardenticatenaceae bacterium]